MDDISDNESEYALSSSDEDSENEMEHEVDIARIWTRVGNPDDHIFPHDIVEFAHHMGPVNPPFVDADPLQYFELLANPTEGKSLLDILVEETNRYAGQQINSPNYHPKPHSRSQDWYDTNVSEMSAFLGLYLSMGIIKKPTIESYWNNAESSWLYSSPGFPSVMRRDRFQNILTFLHCNDNTTYTPRGQEGHDPCHKFRPILDLVNETFPTAYDVARDVTIDESMVGFKGLGSLCI